MEDRLLRRRHIVNIHNPRHANTASVPHLLQPPVGSKPIPSLFSKFQNSISCQIQLRHTPPILLQIFFASGSRRNPRGEVYIYASQEVGVSASAQSPQGSAPGLRAKWGHKKQALPLKQTKTQHPSPADQRPAGQRPVGQRPAGKHTASEAAARRAPEVKSAPGTGDRAEAA